MSDLMKIYALSYDGQVFLLLADDRNPTRIDLIRERCTANKISIMIIEKTEEIEPPITIAIKGGIPVLEEFLRVTTDLRLFGQNHDNVDCALRAMIVGYFGLTPPKANEPSIFDLELYKKDFIQLFDLSQRTDSYQYFRKGLIKIDLIPSEHGIHKHLSLLRKFMVSITPNNPDWKLSYTIDKGRLMARFELTSDSSEEVIAFIDKINSLVDHHLVLGHPTSFYRNAGLRNPLELSVEVGPESFKMTFDDHFGGSILFYIQSLSLCRYCCSKAKDHSSNCKNCNLLYCSQKCLEQDRERHSGFCGIDL